MLKFRFVAVGLMILFLSIGIIDTVSAVPPLPSSFYGEIHFITGDGEPSVGNYVEAYVPGIVTYVSRVAITLYESNLVFSMNVPGDDPDTVGTKDGGLDGDLVTFKINGRVVATATWHSGTNVNLTIHPPSVNTGGPYTGTIGAAISFSGSAVDWLTDETYTYSWDWENDGTYDSSGASTTHSWTSGGDFTIAMKVTDSIGGEGKATASVSVGLANQTITVITNAPGSAEYGSAFTVEATASSGLPVTYSSGNTGICTVLGATFTMISSTGTCLVQYDQAGNSNYEAATRVTENVTATMASQSITVTTNAPTSAVFGSSFTVAATASSGLPVTYSSGSTSVCTVSGSTFTIINGTGTCLVRYDQAGDTNHAPAAQVTESVAADLVSHSIPLMTGWNLVSFNVKPASTEIAAVLSSITGKFDLVYAWDAATSGNPWLKYDDVPDSPDTLSYLTDGMGFWVRMTEPGTLVVEGTYESSTDINLEIIAGGWNLVGYPSRDSWSFPSALIDQGVPDTEFSLIYAYNATDSNDPWKLYDPLAVSYANDLTYAAPGWGYWIYMIDNDTWSVYFDNPNP